MRFTVNPFSRKLDAFEADIGPVGDVEFLAGDSGGNRPPTAGVISILGSPDINVVGSASQLQLTNLTKWTPYVVDAIVGTAPYSTIQAALNAANTAGIPAVVLVRPGQYTENLTLYDGIDIWAAVGVADTLTCQIIGVHTPPASGTITIRNIALQSATHILNSAVAGTTEIIFIDCIVNVTNGYLFNLLNWTGVLSVFNLGNIGTNDGIVNNTGGATIFFTDATLGAGTGNTMIVSGPCTLYNVHVRSPITIQGAAVATINGGCWFDETMTTAGTATVSCANTLFDTEVSQAISHGSANELSLSNVTINSSNNPSIGGAGVGNLTIGDVTYLSNSSLSSTLTENYATVTETGSSYFQDCSLDRGVNHLKTSATGQTVGAATDDLYTLNLGATASAYTFIATVAGYASATGLSVGYTLRGTFETNGAAVTLTGSGSEDAGEEAAAVAAVAEFVASGNNVILRATGVAGSTFNWRSTVEWVRVE